MDLSFTLPSFLTQCLIWFGLPGQTGRYLPGRSHPTCSMRSGSAVHCFRSDARTVCVVIALTKLQCKYLVSRNLQKKKKEREMNFTILKV